ncbi:class I SAM-dependent DNA methyltransferase [Actinoplanes sp. GCM10030250]|uniref:class I SAM-dependent DNA methyltransferase n=1 Tax=Actinoplanes sp. GCM10030250 TaxID=3273376 RepID=UPI00361A168E
MGDSFPQVDPGLYGRQWAADYDLPSGHDDETAPTVAALRHLAGSGPVLEVAAGTGRVAIPLARGGLHVTATDASPEMLDQLRAKPGGDLVDARLDVLPGIRGDDQYGLIYILCNSIWVMQSAEEQATFLRNAAAHLRPDGLLLIEMGIVDTTRLGQPRQFTNGQGSCHVETTWDPTTQRVLHRYQFEETVSPSLRDVHLRFLLPEQLLTMASAAGLEPRFTWADWEGKPFQPDSRWMIAGLGHAESAETRR